MKTEKIRIGMFEVNSSSCHSLSVCLDTENITYQYIEPDEDGNIMIYVSDEDEYGTIETVSDKIAYVIAFANHIYDDAKLTKSILENLKDVVLTHTGANELNWEGSGEIGDFNSEWQSVFMNKELLKRFLFLPKSNVYATYN